jgi:hypothetical protein
MIKLIIVIFLLTGCAAGASFKPRTIEGANCKAECAKDMAQCRGSSYSCDRAASTCMAACQELDSLTK